jgi:hypothetical protein
MGCLSFPGCAFSLGCTVRCASQVLGLPCSPPIRVGEVEILPQLFGYRSCFVALQPDNLFEWGCQAGDVYGPGGRDTLWVSPLVGPPTPVGGREQSCLPCPPLAFPRYPKVVGLNLRYDLGRYVSANAEHHRLRIRKSKGQAGSPRATCSKRRSIPAFSHIRLDKLLRV